MNEWIGGLLCALIGAVHGPATCYVVGAGWIGMLLYALIGAVWGGLLSSGFSRKIGASTKLGSHME